jgi:SHS family lactate transporter-like MFS transporter
MTVLAASLVARRASTERNMSAIQEFRSFTREQRAAFTAGFLGWALDAFDFFLLVFVVKAIADDFHTEVKAVAYAILITLAMRPLGAFVFGRLADRYGRKPVLMLDVCLFSVIELASAFAPSLAVLLVLRALFGFAMGGEWGIGASLVMESIPAKSRGWVSGVLQQGYACGYLVAAVVYYSLFDLIGWRGMFAAGVLPALLVLYIRMHVQESPAWKTMNRSRAQAGMLAALRGRWGLFVYVVVLMTAFNFFSHGTQDLYPTFLQVQHGLSPHAVGAIAVIYNLGAIAGGIFFGALSQRIGRRKAIAAAALLCLPAIPVWAYSTHPALLAAGAFAVQFMVQGAWGVVPAHLNELSPEQVRGTFPGFAYQLGNLIACGNAVIQAQIAANHGGNYSFALALVAVSVAIALAVLSSIGPEARGISMDASQPAVPGP